jgi:ABC-type bacteriocin/lantibiotic exporter with double-glycine peptidase domain
MLDEATSHLDVERERAVNEALRATHMTRIVIAHRPETIRASARVVSLANGAIVDDGPPPSAVRLIQRVFAGATQDTVRIER